MSFDRPGLKRALLAASVFLAFTGCGLFGKKDERGRVFVPQEDGCYNTLADRIQRFFAGKISEAEWASTFDCVNEQVEFFVQFVRPSDERGYTESDIGGLTRRFLITTKPVSDSFISTVFEMKASVSGGDKEFISPKELDDFLRLSNLLRKESLILLPLVRDQANHPTRASNLALADGLNDFGERIGAYFATISGSIPLHKDIYIPFARELLRLTGGDENVIYKYEGFVRNLKVITAGGDVDQIEAGAWHSIFREILGIYGLYSAFADRDKTRFGSDAEESEFYLQLVERAERLLLRVIKSRGGAIRLQELNALVDTVPNPSLDEEKRRALKVTFPKAIGTALRSGDSNLLNARAIRNAVKVYEEGMRGQVHNRRIFGSLPDSVTVGQFEEAALQYARNKSDHVKSEVDDLISTAKLFIGLFPERGSVLRLTPEMKALRTKNHIEKMHWFRTLIRYVFSVYADGPDGSGTEENLRVLSKDLYPVLNAWKMAHPTLTADEMAEKRFLEANLFMPVSNGDQLLSQTEATYYVAFLFSAGSLAGQMYERIVTDGRCPILGTDDLGMPGVSAECFRREYFNNVNLYWDGFPGLARHFARSESARNSMARSMEIAARKGGISDKFIGKYDMDAFSALPHFVEDILDRFDSDSDETLGKNELMVRAFPVFKRALSQFSGQRKTWLLKCSLSYIVKYGKIPRSMKQKVHFLAWCAWKPFWKVSADRVDLYRVVALLSKSGGDDEAPEDAPEESPLRAFGLIEQGRNEEFLEFVQRNSSQVIPADEEEIF